MILYLLAAEGAFAGSVSIVSPTNGSTVSSPVHVHATYNGTVAASYMKLWVDHIAGTVQTNTSVLDTQVTIASGAHLLEVQASDPSTGTIYTTPTNITVSGASVTVTVSPSSSTLPPGGTQQFTAIDSAGLPVTWSATGGTISGTGLYTAGAAPGTFTVTATDSNNNVGTATATVQTASPPSVTIQSPLNGSTVSSPVHVHATYSGTVTATYMKLWVDHVAGTTQHSTNVFDAQVTLNNGTHLLEVQASDPSTGKIYTTPTNITVSGASVTVTVSPISSTLQPGGTQQFTATDSAGLPVTWSATGGTISGTGLYTAGAAPGTFTVTATDSNNNVGTASVKVQSSTVAVTPGSASLPPSGTQQFTAIDSAGLPVTWSATGGTISGTGLYTAGAAPGTFTVTATDANNSVGTASVKVQSSTVAVTPVSVSLPPGGTQQFTATDSAGLPVTWSATGGTISGTGLYTAGAAPGTFTVTATDSNNNVGTATATVKTAGGGLQNYTTWKNDNFRTGQQNGEVILTPGNVNSTHFGVVFSDVVDGVVFAQPLYMANLSLPSGRHNVVFVATEHDSIYAFDADQSGPALWRRSLVPAGASTVPQSLVGSTIYPEIGITGTPVIDPSSNTLYVVAETLESGNVVFKLHALDLITGQEQGSSPVVVATPGWQAKEQLQRPGLLLANGSVYFGIGSQGDNLPYHGWIFAYSAASLAQVGVWNSTSTGSEGAIWMAGSGIAADAAGNVYVITSNGSWNGSSDLSESFVKLSPNLTVLDYFTPYNEAKLSSIDQDLGSGGLLLVPDQAGLFPHEVIGCGKFPAIYVINRDNMGKFQSGSNSQIVQEVDNQVGGTTGKQAPDRCFTTPAYWQQSLFFNGSNDVLKAFSLDASTGQMSLTPTSQGAFSFVFPGAQPVVSSNGPSNGIVWSVDYAPSVALHAYDATNLAVELYRSSGLGRGAKWAVPTVVNGRVYVGTAKKLVVFGPI
ncbi:MAG: hypothetical protein M3O09_04135 [Acidobacteriota bacterium]|nr:hypothetical protein [Acidobacteriota bacterium]